MHDKQDSQQISNVFLNMMVEIGGLDFQSFRPSSETVTGKNAWMEAKRTNRGATFELCTGLVQTDYRCDRPSCFGATISWDTFNVLQLPMCNNKKGSLDLTEMISAYIASKTLRGNERWKCDQCSCNETSAVSRQFICIPEVLLNQIAHWKLHWSSRTGVVKAIKDNRCVIYANDITITLGKWQPMQTFSDGCPCAH